jgi:hypothetical protein
VTLVFGRPPFYLSSIVDASSAECDLSTYVMLSAAWISLIALGTEGSQYDSHDTEH